MAGLEKNFENYQERPPFPRLAWGLNHDSTDATIGGMNTPSDDLTTAKIAAAEARGDTKLARLEGKIDVLAATIVARFDALHGDIQKSDSYNRDTRLITIATIVGAALAIIGIVLAVATYGDALFSRGMGVRDVIQTTIKDTLEQSKRDATKAP